MDLWNNHDGRGGTVRVVRQDKEGVMYGGTEIAWGSVVLRRWEWPWRGYIELCMCVGDRGEKWIGKKITWDPRVPGGEKRGKMKAEANGMAMAGWWKGGGRCRAGPR